MSALNSTALQRGLILLALGAQYPMKLMARALRQQVAGLYPDSKRLEADLAYLLEEDLVQEAVQIVAGQKVTSYRCTSRGYRVAQREEDVIGVEFAD